MYGSSPGHPDHLGDKIAEADRLLFEEDFDELVRERPWVLQMALAGWSAEATANLVAQKLMRNGNGRAGRVRKVAMGTGITVGSGSVIYVFFDFLRTLAERL